MPTLDQMKRERTDLEGIEGVLNQKITTLRRARASEADAQRKFQLDDQLRQAQEERQQIAEQIATLTGHIDAAERPAGPARASRRPTCEDYRKARDGIAGAMRRTDQRRRQMLGQIDYHLTKAEREEGGPEAPEPVRRYLLFERVRLIYLRSQYDDADAQLDTLWRYFSDLDDELTAREIEELRVCIEIQRQLERYADMAQLAPATRARKIVEILSDIGLPETPLVSLLLDQLRKLAQSPGERMAVELLGPDIEAALAPTRPASDEPRREQRSVEQVRTATPGGETSKRDRSGA